MPKQAPPIGTVEQGYSYQGGDPRSPKSWVPVTTGPNSPSEAAMVAARPGQIAPYPGHVLDRPAMPGVASRYAGSQLEALTAPQRASRGIPFDVAKVIAPTTFLTVAPEAALPGGLATLFARGMGGFAGASYGGKKAEELGLPKWSGRAVGGAAGVFAPEVLDKIGGSLISRILGKGPVLSVEEKAEAKVAQLIADRAARVRAGIDPPTEDTIAEVLRQEFLKEPLKSGIPQDIPIPKAKTPTYVPKGVPGFEEAAPEVSKLAEGPTALQHQVAREQALEDIRNATINRPGWVAKLKAQMPALKKMSPQAQRQVITKAITEDPVASAAVRDGARLGSAGDLASWKPEDLWTQYMTEYSKGAKANKQWMKVLQDEVARRGLVKALPGQVRP